MLCVEFHAIFIHNRDTLTNVDPLCKFQRSHFPHLCSTLSRKFDMVRFRLVFCRGTSFVSRVNVRSHSQGCHAPWKTWKVRGKNIGPGKSANFSLGPGFFYFFKHFPMSGTSCRGRENLLTTDAKVEALK